MFTTKDIMNETTLVIVLITVQQSLSHKFTLDKGLKPENDESIVEHMLGLLSHH